MTFLTIQLGAVLVRNVFSQSGHWSLVSQQLLVLLLWFFLYSPVKRGFITIHQNYKSGIPYIWQTHPRSQVREGTFLFFVLCNARLWKQQITQPCMLFQPRDSVKMLPHLPAPAFGGSDLELKCVAAPLPDLLAPYSPLIPLVLREQPLSMSQGVLPLPSGAAFLLFQA